VSLLLRLYTFLGIALGVVSVLAFALTLVPQPLTTNQVLTLSGALAGILLALGSAAVWFSYRARYEPQPERSGVESSDVKDWRNTTRFIEEWMGIETALRHTAAARLGESSGNASLSGIIAELLSANVLSADDAKAIGHLLELRNAVVHQRTSAPISPSDFRQASELSAKLRSGQ
jgi:hypothetical protein